MKYEQMLRMVGVISVVALFGIFSVSQPEVGIRALGVAVFGIVALISPEVIDSLPFGPSRDKD